MGDLNERERFLQVGVGCGYPLVSTFSIIRAYIGLFTRFWGKGGEVRSYVLNNRGSLQGNNYPMDSLFEIDAKLKRPCVF